MTDHRALTITSLAKDNRPARRGTRVTRLPSELLANSSFDRDEGRVAEAAQDAPGAHGVTTE